jgi:hypothetical protein
MAIVVWQDATHVLVYDKAMPKATLQYAVMNGMDEKTVTANKCGIALFEPLVPANTTYTLNGVSWSSKSLPIKLLPRCVEGKPEEVRSSHFKLRNGAIVFMGKPGAEFKVSWRGNVNDLAYANACGIAWIPKSLFTSGSKVQFTIGKMKSASYLVSRDIPFQPDRFRCMGGKLYEKR